VTDQPTLDERLQAGANIKDEITERFNELAALAVLCGDDTVVVNGKKVSVAGLLASQLRCSTNFVNTLADGYVTFGPDYLNAESDPVLWKLDDWLRAILKTDNPAYWLEQARTRQLGAAQIRAEAGVKQERKPPFLDIGATMRKADNQNLLFSPDCELPENTPDECRAELRVRIKDE
jgi:hypothetical protein